MYDEIIARSPIFSDDATMLGPVYRHANTQANDARNAASTLQWARRMSSRPAMIHSESAVATGHTHARRPSPTKCSTKKQASAQATGVVTRESAYWPVT